jgi:histone H3/H4
MQVPDEVYSNEIARRAVARAARRIGVETISEEALDVMADVLLVYLQRVGKTLATLVEASGRSSAHVNVLDALQAVEACTAPAAKQLHLGNLPDEGFNNEIPIEQPKVASTTTGSSSWQDLAVFLFGENWQSQETVSTAQSQAGGKVGPSAFLPKTGGWNAPYRDEVPAFPEASDRCANPHPLSAAVGASLHDNVSAVDEQESLSQQLDRISDSVFTEKLPLWGGLNQSSTPAGAPDVGAKRKRDEEERDTDGDPQARATKKAKLGPEQATESHHANSNRHPLYVPIFFPPFPEPHNGLASRMVVDVEAPVAAESLEEPTNDKTSSATLAVTNVRSSLVHMGMQQQPLQLQGYWGSYHTDDAVLATLRVPQGRVPQDSQGNTSAVVVPLGRASGSRVSRILEGSMDAAQIQ